jgi:phospholipase C
MNKLRVWLSLIVIFAVGGILISLNGCGGTSGTPGQNPPPPGTIKHVVVIFQENRSTDNLFQDPVLISRGADIVQSGKDSQGNTIPLTETSLAVNWDPGHSHHSFTDMCDLNASGQCQMDGADLIKVHCGTQVCTTPDLNFSYVDPTEVAPYFQMAEQFTFADRMFQTNQGPSFPAHQFIISGTSAPSAGSTLFGSENPDVPSNTPPDAGCDAKPDDTVLLIDSTGNEKSNTPIYPCFEHQTLTDLLEAKGNSWRYYTASGEPGGTGAAIWIGPEAIQHICGPNQPPPNGTACVGADWTNHVVLDQTQILNDVANNQLPDVSWVIPDGEDSDHPGTAGTTGPSWVASVVNAVGNSPYWADTAIFITWDDWGGLYDHVPPPQVKVNCSTWGCGYVYGFRVPLIVVSPYAKAQYISHAQHDFGSILKFIESTFGLPSLGYADAVADDLSDCFNYSQTPIKFQTIQTPVKAQYFLNRHTPPKDPDDD